MDFIRFINFILICISSVLGAKPETKSYVGLITHRMTLTCHYDKAQNERLFYIWWYKESPGTGKLLSLASMGETGTPIWESNITDRTLRNFRSRTNAVYVNGDKGDANVYKLDLVTEDLQCDDKGTYVCKVLTSSLGGVAAKSKTNVSVVANPGQPSIPIDELELTENSTYPLRCSANVGLPERPLKWYYKTVNSDKFVEYTGNSEVEYHSSGCVRTMRQRINFEMRSDQDGAEYRCVLVEDESSWNKTQNYDRIIIRLKGAATPEPSSTEAPCKGSKCNAQPSTGDGGGAERAVPGIVFLALPILTLHNLFS